MSHIYLIKDQLELLLDQSNVSSLIDDLINICNEKADHVRTNWQDEALAKAWEKYAEHLSKTLDEIQVMEVKP